ncbi:MAG: toll/interleukin-1 receptor domain-containing protein [Chloroflexi bacterium]|nr:toll/interleukin-1 receptor domain-containing protein [Chloroflexota bacterium]
MSQVFISYASEDREIAHKIKRQLNQAVIDSFYDQDMKEAPDVKEWRDFLRNKILECSCMLVVITPELRAISKSNVIWEWSIMDGRRDENVIIPVAFDVSLNTLNGSRLGDYQGFEIYEKDNEAKWESLFTRIRAITQKVSIDEHVLRAEIMLYSPIESERKSAQGYLVNYDHEDAIRALEHAIDSKSFDVSTETAMALSSRQPNNIKCIGGFEHILREYAPDSVEFTIAALKLGEMDVTEAVTKFRELLWNPEFSRDKKEILINSGLRHCYADGVNDLLRDLLRDMHMLELNSERPFELLVHFAAVRKAHETLEPLTDMVRELPVSHSMMPRIVRAIGEIGDEKSLDDLKDAFLRCSDQNMDENVKQTVYALLDVIYSFGLHGWIKSFENSSNLSAYIKRFLRRIE